MRLAPTLLLLAVATSALADGTVYRYVDKDGVTHYTDKPPTPDAKPADLPPLQTIGPGTPLSEVLGDAAPAGGTSSISLTVTSPAADETLRGDDRKLTVSVRVDRPLPQGVGLQYLLDGSAQNSKPVQDFSYTMEGVERGSHIVAVAAVDATGREVGRSAPVIVHMKPPTIDQAPKINRPPPQPVPKPTPK